MRIAERLQLISRLVVARRAVGRHRHPHIQQVQRSDGHLVQQGGLPAVLRRSQRCREVADGERLLASLAPLGQGALSHRHAAAAAAAGHLHVNERAGAAGGDRARKSRAGRVGWGGCVCVRALPGGAPRPSPVGMLLLGGAERERERERGCRCCLPRPPTKGCVVLPAAPLLLLLRERERESTLAPSACTQQEPSPSNSSPTPPAPARQVRRGANPRGCRWAGGRSGSRRAAPEAQCQPA